MSSSSRTNAGLQSHFAHSQMSGCEAPQFRIDEMRFLNLYFVCSTLARCESTASGLAITFNSSDYSLLDRRCNHE